MSNAAIRNFRIGSESPGTSLFQRTSRVFRVAWGPVNKALGGMIGQLDQQTFSRQIVRGAEPTVLPLAICHVLNMGFKAVSNLSAILRISDRVDNSPDLENRAGGRLTRRWKRMNPIDREV
jgi:hypothetical protein